MTIDSRALIASGVEIGQAVFMEESQPVDLSFFGRRYLQSGNVETDTSKFDTSIFTGKFLTNFVERFDGGNNSAMIAYSGSLYISTGGNYGIADSPDAITWTARGVPVTGTPQQRFVRWSSVANEFLTGGSSSLVVVGDGVNWTESTLPFAGQAVNDAAYGAAVWVAVGDNNTLASSPNGTSWTNRTSNISGDILSATYSPTFGLFVIGTSTGLMATSPDGITWTARTSAHGTDDITSIIEGNGKLVAVGDKFKISTSVDGINWVDTGQSPTSGFLDNISFDGGVFVCANTSTVDILISTDGVLWTASDTGVGQTSSSTLINGTLVVTGSSGHKLSTSDLSAFAGSATAHAENGENQYIRIS